MSIGILASLATRRAEKSESPNSRVIALQREVTNGEEEVQAPSPNRRRRPDWASRL